MAFVNDILGRRNRGRETVYLLHVDIGASKIRGQMVDRREERASMFD